MRRAISTAAVVATALALGACGESDADKAQTTVCNARDDISKQVDDLKGLTAATFSTDAVSKSLEAIRSDLSEIRGAQSDLDEDRRQQIESANQAFADQVKGVVKQVGTSISASDAKTQITAALQQLGDSYEQTLGRVDCS
jgi:hypothetical protein